MGKKNSKLTGPDYKLDEYQFKSLNEEFYKGFLDDFYSVKVVNLLSLITNAEKFINDIKDKPIEIDKLTIIPNDRTVGEKSVVNYAKVELAMSYFHCLETFIRLFIAHAKLSGCPWLDLARLSIPKYKEALKKISEGKFKDLNDRVDEDQMILYVFTGQKEPDDKITKEFIEGYKEWLSFAASQLLETYDYNSFKHGLAVSSSQNGITIFKDDGTPLFKAHGDVIEHLTRTRREDRFKWAKQMNFVSYDKKVTFIITLERLMRSILDVGEGDYVNNGCKEVNVFKAHEFLPDRILIEKEGEIQMSSYLQELLYYK
ncbi:hypothetical protein MOC97_13000 [Bacillus atrophaeus]|uniref:hypothetical protein n=1 Tax=Bacillus atrophaeus TaxID=1452 RepID=UPI00227F1F72|nr:hypothetical protein [Bacillus atrophaeus]MCY8486373.1 hypothetical protein [Bacillus atrophaeus]MCY8989805.1 hypothetical protein [Bacillus atrophaeus]